MVCTKLKILASGLMLKYSKECCPTFKLKILVKIWKLIHLKPHTMLKIFMLECDHKNKYFVVAIWYIYICL